MKKFFKDLGFTILIIAIAATVISLIIAMIPFLLGLGSLATFALIVWIVYNAVKNRDLL